MRIAIVENTRSTQHGQLGIAMHEAAASIDLYKPWAGQALPRRIDADALVVFGGEQSAIDDARHPYLPHLADLMRLYSTEDHAVMGICLGSQILARAFGAENLLQQAPEFGWCEVAKTAEGAKDPVLGTLPERFRIYQMHSDTFTLPDGATRLAESPEAANQAFRIGRATYGMQFHFEANRAVAAAWNRDFPQVIEAMRPGWITDMPLEAARHGAAADRLGLEISRAWVAQI